jgi:hypothetical protein
LYCFGEKVGLKTRQAQSVTKVASILFANYLQPKKPRFFKSKFLTCTFFNFLNFHPGNVSQVRSTREELSSPLDEELEDEEEESLRPTPPSSPVPPVGRYSSWRERSTRLTSRLRLVEPAESSVAAEVGVSWGRSGCRALLPFSFYLSSLSSLRPPPSPSFLLVSLR